MEVHNKKKRRYLTVVLLATLQVTGRSGADTSFKLDFTPNTMSGANWDAGEVIQSGTDPMLDFSQQQVVVNGDTYFRQLLGDPATGFAYEVYTRIRSSDVEGGWHYFNAPCNSSTPNCQYAPTLSGGMLYMPEGGGMERKAMGNGGSNLFGGNFMNLPDHGYGNAGDPLGVYAATFVDENKALIAAGGLGKNARGGTGTGLEWEKWDLSGTGTGDPTKMVMRLVLDTGDMRQEVYKPFLGRKPLITQTTQDKVVRSQFLMDMRSISYRDMDTPAVAFNKTTVIAPDIPLGAADFDMSMVDESRVTGGRYIYTPGTGWNTPSGGWDVVNSEYVEGTYTYMPGEGGFDPLREKWEVYFDSYNCTQTSHADNKPGYGC